LLIAVDQEGGRVQRFRDGFTRLPAVRNLGHLHDEDPRRALRLARVSGWLMAIELRTAGVDHSFAPVLDLDRGISGVIGDRAFHSDPAVVGELAHAYMIGMRRAGMEACGKHFPGHGSVSADSHTESPTDSREFETIVSTDLLPFRRLAGAGIAALMAAHVIYPRVADRPAGFAATWIKDVLRQQLGFQGLVVSDDLDMAAALVGGGPEDRARAALEAGCDLVLACNDRGNALRILEGLGDYHDPVSSLRLARMHGLGRPTPERLARSPRWRKAVDWVKRHDENPLLDMDL